MGTNIFAFIIVLGVLIFAHEFGHFIVARLCGVGVEKFSLGFGPRIFGKKIGITDYRLSAIPLGGYVKMVGEEPGQELEPDQIPLSFTHKHVFKRILVVAAGPAFNVLLAVLIFFGLFLISGIFIVEPTIGKVGPGTPAELSGLKAQDRVVAVDGTAVGSWDEMAKLIGGSEGQSLEVTIERGGEQLTLQVTPRRTADKNIFGEDIERFVIGITSAGEVFTQELGPVAALTESVRQTYQIIKLTVLSVIKIIQGTVSSKNLGGPIMIAEMAGQQAKQGASNLAFFIALLSINLAILNILPIPVLDGGHLLFFTIEAIIRRPVNTRVREIAQQAGVFILIMLMILVFYNDIMRIFSSPAG